MKLRTVLTSLTALGLVAVATTTVATHEKTASAVTVKENSVQKALLDFRMDIGSFVTDTNSHLTLVGVNTASSDTEITKAIIKAIAVLGTDLMHFPVSEGLISPHINIILDSNTPHSSAVVVAKDGDLLIKGSAAITFTLDAVN